MVVMHVSHQLWYIMPLWPIFIEMQGQIEPHKSQNSILQGFHWIYFYDWNIMFVEKLRYFTKVFVVRQFAWSD